MRQLGIYISQIPEAQRRAESGSAMIGYLVQRALGGKSETLEDFYTGYARKASEDIFEYAIAKDIRRSVKLGILTQEVLTIIGVDSFRQAMRDAEE